MIRPTKKTAPELFCAFARCNKRLSKAQLRHNAERLYYQDAEHVAQYCCRAHKEQAAQQRRREARRALASGAAA